MTATAMGNFNSSNWEQIVAMNQSIMTYRKARRDGRAQKSVEVEVEAVGIGGFVDSDIRSFSGGLEMTSFGFGFGAVVVAVAFEVGAVVLL